MSTIVLSHDPGARTWRSGIAIDPTRIVGFGIAAMVLFAAWWLLTSDKVTERMRTDDVEMIDLAEPPPPPPPEEVPVEKVEQQVEQTVQAQAVQRDPLSAVQPAATNPPAGDLSSLLSDPSADSGAFVGGARGQGGKGNGPMIGGTGGGVAQASRAYADSVMQHIRRVLQRNPGLKGKPFKVRLKVSVSPGGAISIGSIRGAEPPDLEGVIGSAVRGIPAMDRPPPEGLPNFINIDINQN